jgi:hypothetical protein
LPKLGIADHLPAKPADRLVLGLEDLDLRQPVLRDPVAEHPARSGVALEDRDVMTGQQQVVGGGHAGRPGPDHRGGPARLLPGLEREGGSTLSSSIALMTWSPA